MANVSAFGFGGWDPLGFYGEGTMLSLFHRANAKRQAKLNYHFAQLYALNSPSWLMQGYRNAGINPILAASHGQLNVPNNPTTIAPTNLGTSTNGVDSIGFSSAPWSPQTRVQREAYKQAEIKTESDQSALEAQRSRDMLDVIQNTAKIGVLMKGIATDAAGRPSILVTKEGDSSKPWLDSPYSSMGKSGPIHSDSATPAQWQLRKAYEDDLELGSERYIRQTIPLITQSAKDFSTIISKILPSGKLGAILNYINHQPTRHSGKNSGSSKRR